MKYISTNSIAIKTIIAAVLVFGFSNIKAQTLTGGWGSIYYICPDSTISAIGKNDAYQLGDGTNKKRDYPVKVKGLQNVVAIDGPSHHAVLVDGTVWEWAGNYNYTPPKKLNIDNVASVTTALMSFGCGIGEYVNDYIFAVLKKDGSVWVWNYEYNNTFAWDYGSTPQKVTIPKVKKLVGGTGFFIALCEDGTVWTWGNSKIEGNGNLVNYPDNIIIQPQQVKSLSNIIDIANGPFVTASALRNDGTLWHWGCGVYTDDVYPRKVDIDVKSIFSSGLRVGNYCARLKNNGTLIFPYFSYQFADTVKNIPNIVSVTTQSTFGYSLDNKFVYNFVQDADGNMWRWGDNSIGQLGNFTTFPIDKPEVMPKKCVAVDCDTITKNPDLHILDTLVYPNESTKLKTSLSDADLYWWYPNSNIVSGKNDQESTVRISNETEFIAVIMDTYGCMRKERFILRKKCPQNRQVLDTLITPGSYLKLKASDARWYTWTPTEGLSCSDCQTPTARIYANTEYVAYLTDNYNCQWTERFKITNNCDKSTLLNPPVIVDTVTYPNAQLNLTAPKNKEYSWLPSTGLSCGSCKNPTATVTNPIEYSVSMVDSFYCASKAKYNIRIRDCDTIVRQSNVVVLDTTIHYKTAIPFLASESYNGYIWNPTVGLSCSDCQTPIFTAKESAEYTVSIINSWRCPLSETFKITMVNLDIVIPNVFTPNGDGINDYFEVKNIKPNSTLKILNSNEALVFSASNYEGNWNGTDDSGRSLPEGTYWYILDIPDSGKFTGWLYIKR